MYLPYLAYSQFQTKYSSEISMTVSTGSIEHDHKSFIFGYSSEISMTVSTGSIEHDHKSFIFGNNCMPYFDHFGL